MAPPTLPPLHAELTEAVASLIRRRTGGQLADVTVGASDGTIVIRSVTSSYYPVQLAIHALQTWLSESGLPTATLYVEFRDDSARGGQQPGTDHLVRLTLSL